MTDTATLEGLEPAAHAPAGAQGTVPIDSITVLPEQERDPGDLTELARSIRLHGVLNPVLVRNTDQGYVLVAGGRRLKAARMAGLTEIPVHAKGLEDDTDTHVLRLVENVQRRNLHPVEEGRAYADLKDRHGLSQQEIARRTGRSALHVSKRLSLLNLHPEVQSAIMPGDLSIGEAEDIARLSDPAEQLAAMREIREGNSSDQVVQRRLSARERAMSAESIRRDLIDNGAVEFTGTLGRDGFPVSDEPQPGYLYWPVERMKAVGDVQDFQFQVSDLGEVTWVTTNPEIHIGDDDPEVVASATALVQRAQVAAGEAGTMAAPLEPATKDEAERERARAERARLKQLKRRDEEREAHLNKLIRRGVAYPKVGEFTLRTLIDAAPSSAREIAFTRCRVSKVENPNGFGEVWDLDGYLAQTKGDGMLRLAYALALQLHEDVLDRAVTKKLSAIEGGDRDRVSSYLDFLGGVGYPGSAEEFALIGEDEPDEAESEDEDGESGDEAEEESE